MAFFQPSMLTYGRKKKKPSLPPTFPLNPHKVMNRLNKLGAVLTVLFAFCVFALMAELVYVLWRRRRFRRRSVSGSGNPEMSGAQFYTPSKELLYFFCWENQSRVEPAGIPPVLSYDGRDSEAAVVDEVEKCQDAYGPSRVLYTIKEEEKEGAESSEYSAESEAKSKSRSRRVSLRDALAAKVLSEAALAAVAADDVEVEAEAKAVTPYYTPSSSPDREESVISGESGGSGEEETETETDFLSIRVEE